MAETLTLPPISQKEMPTSDKYKNMATSDNTTKEDSISQQVTVNVFDSRSSQELKLQTKLNHDEASWFDEIPLNLIVNEHHQQKFPVMFKTNNMSVSKRTLKDLLLTGQFALADLDTMKIGKPFRQGKNKQGHIVMHKDIIDSWQLCPQNQIDCSGQLEFGESTVINNSKEQHFVKSGVGTDTSGEAVVVGRSTQKTEKGSSRCQTLLTCVGQYKDNKKQASTKSSNLKTIDERNLLEKSTQTSDDVKNNEDVGKEKVSSDKNEAVTEKPTLTLCNIKREEIKDMKAAIQAVSDTDSLGEGRRIWEEVDAIIKSSIPYGKLRKGKEKPDPPSAKGLDIKHSIEHRDRFRRIGKQYFHFEPEDHMWTMLSLQNEEPCEKDLQPQTFYFDNKETTFDRVYGNLPENGHMDSMHQYFDRNGSSNFSGNGKTFMNIGMNGPRQSFPGGIPFIQRQVEYTKYAEMLRFLDQRPDFDCVNIHLIHPAQTTASAPPSIPDGACRRSKMMMTTTLPRLTPASTPLPTGVTQPPPRSHSSASMYVPYPPKDLSSSMDYMKMPQRINPLRPPPPRKRINWSWETVDQHHENEKRRLLMQKREHTRYHSAWAKAFYGAPAEKEAYRRHYREVLKQQMDDRDSMRKEQFQQKVKESERALAYDKQCQINDANEFHRKHSYLQQYRDGNKQQMEDKWAHVRFSKQVEDRIDRERLRYNPINWSCSLK